MSQSVQRKAPGEAPAATAGGRRSVLWGLWRPLLVVAAIVTVAVVTRPDMWIGNVGEAREWIRERGLIGILVFLAVYLVAAVAIVPQALLKVTAGALFGAWLGIVIASIGSTLGATACFLIARYVASGSLVRRLKEQERIKKLDRMTRKHGAAMVAISRLVPVLPGNLINYGFGLTQVRLATFVFFSWLCMLPGTIVVVVGTDAILSALTAGEVPWALVLIAAGALLLLAAGVAYAHRRFKEREAEAAELNGDAHHTASAAPSR